MNALVAAADTRSPARKIMLAIALAVALFTVALSVLIGRPPAQVRGAAPAPAQQTNEQAKAAEFGRMVAGLEQKLRQHPDNPEGWAMLARSYKTMGRAADAEKAFERAGAYVDDDAQLLADYADVTAAATGSFSGKPAQLLARALKVDPGNLTALWLAGTAAANAADRAGAVRLWERLLKALPPNSEEARKVEAAIEQVRPEGGKGTNAAAGAGAASTSAAVAGTVQLDPGLKAQTRPDDTVMVLARVPGAPVPVAVLRARAADLPLSFKLDDATALNPRAPISQAREVEVEARVTRSGQPAPQPGDLMSAPQLVKVGSRGIALKVALVRQ